MAATERWKFPPLTVCLLYQSMSDKGSYARASSRLAPGGKGKQIEGRSPPSSLQFVPPVPSPSSQIWVLRSLPTPPPPWKYLFHPSKFWRWRHQGILPTCNLRRPDTVIVNTRLLLSIPEIYSKALKKTQDEKVRWPFYQVYTLKTFCFYKSP